MPRIDLNCDVGEGAGHDAEIMPYITSANIACGTHAGNEATMREIFRLAEIHGVAVGAHPGFADRANFGRVERPLGAREAVELVNAQVAALAKIAGKKLRHVKLHGALYHQISRDPTLAAAVADGLARDWPRLILFALAGSEFHRAARRRGLSVASEVFADRTYQPDGTLTPRARPKAMILEEDVAVAQALRFVLEGVAIAVDGTKIPLPADTLCLHGDTVTAVAFAKRLRRELQTAGVELRSFEQ